MDIMVEIAVGYRAVCTGMCGVPGGRRPGMRTWKSWICAMGLAFGLLLVPLRAHALDPALRCESGKLKEAGRHANCRLRSESVAVKRGAAPDHAKCTIKFSGKWSAVEAKGSGVCPTSGDAADIDGRVAAFGNEVAGCLNGGACATCAGDLATCLRGCPASPAALLSTGQLAGYGSGSDGALQLGVTRSYTDNGDGTITDDSTGLMWEKKSADGSVHDWNNRYWWGSFSKNMSGTMVTAFLDVLNDVAGGGANCFADYCDWRIPNVNELESVLDYGSVAPAVDPVFHTNCTPGCTVTTCSCTRSFFYQASSTYAGGRREAWVVGFGGGGVFTFSKQNGYAVRAVRGGL